MQPKPKQSRPIIRCGPIKITNDDGFHELVAGIILVAVADARGLSRDDDFRDFPDMHQRSAQDFLETVDLDDELLEKLIAHVEANPKRRKAA